jgi:hypothetical protein
MNIGILFELTREGIVKPFEIVLYKGKKIVLVDISNTNTEQILAALPAAQKQIAFLPPKSALILTDVTNTVYNKEVSAAIKEFSAKNTPYVRASAVVGVDGLRSVLLQAVTMITHREIKACKTRDEAIEWLAAIG